MTCALSTPWWLPRTPFPAGCDGSTAATRILDHEHPAIRALARGCGLGDPRDTLRRAHALVRERVRPVYAVTETRRTSRTLALGRGSCSQRFAVLEPVARHLGVPTRVHGLLVDGEFWAPRFPALRPVLPSTVVLAWPEFGIDGTWGGVPELFGGTSCATVEFGNCGPETLFDAVARGSVDLSPHLVADLGRVDDRDTLFAAHGQTLSAPARAVLGPLLERGPFSPR